LWAGPSGTRQTIALDTATTGSLLLNVSGTPAASLIWRGTNGVNWDTSTVNWANGSSGDIFYNLDAVTFDDSGANPASVTLPAAVSPAAITVNSSQNYTFSGSPITGGGALTKLGSSTLTIANSNAAYSGAINIFGGTLSAAAGSSLGNGAMTISNGATFALPSSSPSVFFGGTMTIPANTTGTISSGALGNGLSGNLFSGNTNSVLNLVSGVSFSGTSSAQFDNFTGTINIQSGGSLRYSANSSGNTFGSLAPTLVINGTLQPRNAGNTVVLGAFSGTGILASAQSPSGTGDTLYLIGGNNSDANFSGNISSNSAVAGSDVGVTKLGSGTLTLSGSSTFGSGTTVSAGTLRVNNSTGSGTGTGDLEVFSDAILTGNGIIGSATTIDGGATLAPGNPTGTLTFTSSLALNDSSYLPFALGTSSDSVAVSGDLILTGQLSVTNAAGFGAGTYTLFTYGTLALGNLAIASAPVGYNYTISTNTPGAVKLVVSPTAPPVFGNVSISGGNLTLAGSNGIPFGNYWVQQSSNLVNWVSIVTNQFDANGGFNFTTNAPAGSPQNFFRLQLP
jgi:autotransporter-associated beta strand protein